MEGVVIAILLIIIGLLTYYNFRINKNLKNLNGIKQKVTSLNVLQEFMSTIGEESSVDAKIRKINEILIEKYDIKYSTIVTFNGAEYEVKATNVNEKHWETLKNLHNEEIFKDSISMARPKYITVNKESERLPYQKLEFGRAKSAIFFPLYIDNIYIGYWIIESGVPHAFDNIDTTILEVVKDNILSVIKTVSYQNVIESLPRKDLYSQLTTAEYLYGKGKKIIDRYTTSTICMFKIINLEYINEEYSRQIGNEMITKVTEFIKDNISEEYIFVRYMGPKFVIVFSGIEIEGVEEFLKDLKKNVENVEIEFERKGKNTKIEKVKPLLNFVISTYYKGTALESLNKKLEEYLDMADKEESEINSI